MARILILAYYFPPIGGAGAQRPAKFVRFLPERGHEPVVITGPGDSIGRWTPPDETLGTSIADAAEVVRIAGPEPAGHAGLGGRLKRWLGVASAWGRWWVDGVVRDGRAVDDVDLIYAWMSPYESAEAAARLSRELGKPWVADLGDPWALDEMMVYLTGIHRRRECRRMRRLLGTAAAVIVSTPEAARQIREAFPELRSKPIIPIPNGFDADDFAGEASTRDDGIFRIVHTGYLHTELGRQQRRMARLHRFLRGGSEGVDILTRSHVYLLAAIDALLRRRPDLRPKLEVHFAGIFSEADREVARRFDFVHLYGYLPHAESIDLLRSGDLLFLPMQKLAPGRRSSTVPGKTYEYVASRRPVLAAVPPGDAHDILERFADADLCAPDDVDAMARAVEQRMQASASPTRPEVNRDALRRFEYRQLTARIADVFDRVLTLHGEARRPPLRVASSSVDEVRARAGRQRTVTHIAYFFPPIGGAGAQRSLKFVRYLPLFGFASKVITGSGESGGRWTPADESLVEEVEQSSEIHRVAGPEPAVAGRWRSRLERWFSLRGEWSEWWRRGVVDVGERIGSSDVLLASMSPYETAEAARDLAVRTERPWVAGLRDPWALDEMMVFPTGFHRGRELARMRRTLSTAAAIVVTSHETIVALRDAFPEFAAKPIVSIPNGFDASDFEGAPPERSDGVFRIVHTGYLHTELGRKQRQTARAHRVLRGEANGVDILTRSHVYLLAAVEQLLAGRPELRSRIEIHLAGVLSADDREVAERSGVVRLHGYLPHTESIALVRSADLLFLPMQNLPPGRRSSTVPGKTYEYIASGRPILAAIPEGDARDILEAVGTALFCRPGDSAEIGRIISSQFDLWEDRIAPAEPAPQVLARFERRYLAGELAIVLDAVAALTDPGSFAREDDHAPTERKVAYAT
jgi:glycosyltransferase involved in cell wall biosynthesis